MFFIFVAGRHEFPNLFRFAERVFQLIAGGISSERVWSTFGFVHNTLRNKLNSERLEKLAFVYTNKQLFDEDDQNDYTDLENNF